MRQSAVSFKAKGLNFEGVVAQPEGAMGPMAAVVFCHPHPLFGGNMDNSVVLALANSLVDKGFATLRFNFRGVGNSEGEHSKGELEYVSRHRCPTGCQEGRGKEFGDPSSTSGGSF